MAFDSLTEKLQNVFKNLRSKGRLTEDDVKEAIDYINNNQQDAATVLAQKQDVTPEEMMEWLQKPGCVFDMKLDGVMNTANFMAESGFIEEAPESLEAITTPSAR